MRALLLAFSVCACVSPSALRRVEALQAATCQRFEEYQVAQAGRVTHPCRPSDAAVTLTPQTVFISP